MTEERIREIVSHCDHTQLAVTAGWEDIRALIDDAVTYGTASVCIPPCYVKQAVSYAAGRVPVCTVIGFPNGYNTTAAKCAEAEEAIRDGAAEIDMVINVGALKAGNDAYVLAEGKALRAVCRDVILKVIIETCLLTDEEKIRMCGIVTEAGADYIKTSTGFSKAGATFEDVKLFAAHVGPNVKIKAAGGISSLEDADEFLKLGADRLGTSRVVKIVKARENSQ